MPYLCTGSIHTSTHILKQISAKREIFFNMIKVVKGTAGLLVSAHTDGMDVLQAEVPHDIWVEERSHKATTGCINQDGQFPPILLVKVLCA